jgi:DNA-binding PadR family transcriptional regulator
MGTRDKVISKVDSAVGAAIGAVEATWSPSVWLVLALIIEQPSHGYETYQRYEARFGGFFPTSRPALYATLGRLREAGMIEPIVLEPIGRSRKQHDSRRSYRGTRAGVHAYRRWVAERMRDDPDRPQFLGRIASTGLLGPHALMEVVDRYEDECTQAMKVLPTADPEAVHGDVSELVEALVLDQQRREMRASLDWAVHARRILRAHMKRIAAEQAEGS